MDLCTVLCVMKIAMMIASRRKSGDNKKNSEESLTVCFVDVRTWRNSKNAYLKLKKKWLRDKPEESDETKGRREDETRIPMCLLKERSQVGKTGLSTIFSNLILINSFFAFPLLCLCCFSFLFHFDRYSMQQNNNNNSTVYPFTRIIRSVRIQWNL